ncbi:hypothetical protein Tco_1241613 [Tanacetum coccineum]
MPTICSVYKRPSNAQCATMLKHSFTIFRVPTGMLTLEPFSEDQGRSAVHPLTRTHVRLLGPCFMTGRMGCPQAGSRSAQVPKHTVTARAANHDRRDSISTGISTARALAAAPIRTGPRPESICGPAYIAGPHSLPSRQFQALFDSLFKVLFIFPSRYLFAIGLTPIFSLGRNLPPYWGCIPKQPDSQTAPRGATGLRRARKLGQVATTCEEPSGQVYVVRGNLVKSLRRARNRRGRFTSCEETWSSRYDVRGTVGAGLRRARKLGQVATTCEEPSGQVYVVRGTLVVFSLGRNLPPYWGCIPKQPDSQTAPRGATGSGHDASPAPPSKGLGPGPSLRTLLQTTIRTAKQSDFQAGLFPVRSPLLRESLGSFCFAQGSTNDPSAGVTYGNLVTTSPFLLNIRFQWNSADVAGSNRPHAPRS